jgi:CRISPR-associated protein Csx3
MMTATVIYSIGICAPITPAEPLPPLPEIPRGSLVVVEGRAPIWRRGMALHLLHGSPAAAIAFYDPRLGAVVVATHSREWAVGQVVEITLPQAEATQVRKSRCRKKTWPH